MKIKNIAANEVISPYSLSQPDNYKNMLNSSIHEILDKYILLVNDYMLLISDKIYIKKTQYYKYIFIRGLDTITSVFKFMLFYTKNIDLTYYHSQKAFYFYVEFIEQISNDQNTFLQLSSREACMFVYKKTIYELMNDYKKTNKLNRKEEEQVFNSVNKYLLICKNIIVFCVNHNDFTYENKIIYINELSKKIKKHGQDINHHILSKDNLECYELFINNITDKNITIDQLFYLSESFIKIIDKKKIMNYPAFLSTITNKIYFMNSYIKDDKIFIAELFNEV